MLLGGSTSSLATKRTIFCNILVALRILGSSESLKMASSSRGSDRNLRLRVEDWTDSDENEPPPREKEPLAKRKRLFLQKKGRDNGPLFLSIVEEATLSEKCVPKNTAISTKWAMSNMECWHKRRNETFNLEPERQVPDGLLLGHDSAAICKWLSVYVLTAKENVTYQQQFAMQSIISMPVPQPHYSFSNCNVTFNSFPPGHQQHVGTSPHTNAVNHD